MGFQVAVGKLSGVLKFKVIWGMAYMHTLGQDALQLRDDT